MQSPGAAEWTVVLTTVFVVGAAVILHFETIATLNRWARERGRGTAPDHHHRPTLLMVMFALLGAHVVEIWLGAFWALISEGGHGAIVGYDTITFWDCVYFSATTYTTVGWGDLAPVGAIRFLAGTTALAGFMLITWSASFVYLIMSRSWGRSNG